MKWLLKEHGWMLVGGIVLTLMGVVFMAAPATEAQTQHGGALWSCSADDIGATLTIMQASPPGSGQCLGLTGQKRLVTYIVAQSTTTTAGTFILRYGTGTNCGTGTVSLIPSAATAARLAAPANTAAPTVILLSPALAIPAGQDLCVLGVATNTFTGQVGGHLGTQ